MTICSSIPEWCCRSFPPSLPVLRLLQGLATVVLSIFLNLARHPSCAFSLDRGSCLLSPEGSQEPYFSRKLCFRVRRPGFLRAVSPASHSETAPGSPPSPASL